MRLLRRGDVYAEIPVGQMRAPADGGTQQLARDLGVSFRQLDYWIRKGYLGPRLAVNPGQGQYRTFSPVERRLAVLIAEGLRAGFTLKAAAHRAALSINKGDGAGLAPDAIEERAAYSAQKAG